MVLLLNKDLRAPYLRPAANCTHSQHIKWALEDTVTEFPEHVCAESREEEPVSTSPSRVCLFPSPTKASKEVLLRCSQRILH